MPGLRLASGYPDSPSTLFNIQGLFSLSLSLSPLKEALQVSACDPGGFTTPFMGKRDGSLPGESRFIFSQSKYLGQHKSEKSILEHADQGMT